jgi:nucleoside-diphosphate-sugar epimerase
LEELKVKLINYQIETCPYIKDTNSNAYYVSKMKEEKILLSSNGKEGLMTVAIRPHRIFGPRDVTLVPNLINAARYSIIL